MVLLNGIVAVSPQKVPSAFVGDSDLRRCLENMSSKGNVPVTKAGTVSRKERMQYLLKCMACEKLCLSCWMDQIEEYLVEPEQLGYAVHQQTQICFLVLTHAQYAWHQCTSFSASIERIKVRDWLSCSSLHCQRL